MIKTIDNNTRFREVREAMIARGVIVPNAAPTVEQACAECGIIFDRVQHLPGDVRCAGCQYKKRGN